MIEIKINDETYLFDDVKAREDQTWYDKREAHVIWVTTGGRFGKKDEDYDKR